MAAEATVSFLAYLSCGTCDAPSVSGPLVFDRTKYNYGSHYSTSSGKFTAPVTGLYLITSQLFGRKNIANYWLTVDGDYVTFINERNGQGNDGDVMGYTNVVLKLNAGQQLWIDPAFISTDAVLGTISSWFGAHLLKTL